VIEGVGGESLGAALQRVAPYGIVVNFASSDPAPTCFPARSLFVGAPRAVLRGLYVFDELGREGSGSRDLTRLAALVADGRLECSIDREDSWAEATQAVADLLDRRIAGKVVLHVD
jgi:NADPH:quinone reductase